MHNILKYIFTVCDQFMMRNMYIKLLNMVIIQNISHFT